MLSNWLTVAWCLARLAAYALLHPRQCRAELHGPSDDAYGYPC